MTEYTRDPSNTKGEMASTGGSGSTGGGHKGGTGYTGGTGGNDGGRHRNNTPPPNDREPKSTAAIWIVGIVVVVGALAIWIARNTVDDADTMQSRPGMEQRSPDRDLERNDTYDGYDNNTSGDRDLEREDVQRSTGATLEDRGTLDAQQGTGTIEGDTEVDRRFETSGASTGTTGTSTGGTIGTTSNGSSSGTGSGTGDDGTGTGEGTQGSETPDQGTTGTP